MKRFECDESGLPGVVAEIRSALPEGGVVILQGDLAAGKTTLVKAFAASMGIDEPVTSPTFSLQQRYGERLFHYDIYSQGLEHFMALGLFEELERPGYHLVEWGDGRLFELSRAAGLDTVRLQIEKQPDTRIYRIDHA